MPLPAHVLWKRRGIQVTNDTYRHLLPEVRADVAARMEHAPAVAA